MTPQDPADSKSTGLWIVAIVLLFIAYEAFSYWASVSGGAPKLGPLLATGPLAAIVCWAVLRVRGLARLALVATLTGLGALLWARHAVPDLTLLYPLPPVLVYGFLLSVFSRTLLPGREAIITRVARMVHGSLPPEIQAHTRRVTWAWCIFFAAMAATSVLLFVFAPLRTWSLFTNVLSLPLIVSMFVGEYVYRVWRYPTFSHVSLLHTARAFRRFGSGAAADGSYPERAG